MAKKINDVKVSNHSLTDATKKRNIGITVIFDMSGSMDDLKRDVIGSYNSFLEEYKKDTNNNYLTLILFNTDMKTAVNNMPINLVKKLDAELYQPNGGTALYDSVGTVLLNLKEKNKYLDVVFDRQLVVIITDGEENSSKLYSASDIKKDIGLARENKIEFIFLTAAENAMFNAENMGINKGNTMFFSNTSTGYRGMSKSVSNTMSYFSNASDKDLECCDSLFANAGVTSNNGTINITEANTTTNSITNGTNNTTLGMDTLLNTIVIENEN